MLQTIIVGIDGREQDDEALALAERLGEAGAEIIATSVGVFDARAPSRQTEPSSRDAAETIVDQFIEARPGTEGGVTTARSVGRGLADVARGARADLIVVASSRHGALGKVFAGDSVADVLRHAPCPVAIAPVGYHAEGPLTQIVVGYDGSPEADHAVHEAVALASRDDASISVVEVVEPFVAVTAAGVSDPREVDLAYQRANSNLDHLAEQYGLHGVISTGRATHELAEASRASDLLCVGLHRHGVLDRLLIGSTVHALLRGQAAPLLVMPPEAVVRTSTDGLDVAPVAP